MAFSEPKRALLILLTSAGCLAHTLN